MMMLIAGMVLFFGAHLVRVVAPDFRESMIIRLGPWGWKGLYAIISLAGFMLLVAGYSSVRWTSPLLWAPPPGWVRMAPASLHGGGLRSAAATSCCFACR